MDFLIEPLIETNDLIVDDIAAACCSSGSGCSSGMAQNVSKDDQ
jgi:hypothetical protein